MPVGDVDAARSDLASYILEVAEAFLADDVEVNCGALLLETAKQRPAFLDEVRVEAARQPTIGCQQNNGRALDLFGLPKQGESFRELRRVEI